MKAALDNLKRDMQGGVILPGDADYEQARKLYNGMIDKHPKIILKCISEEDVVRGVNFGREQELELAIRSGGHSGAGLGSVEGGLVLDLSQMKGIEIDPQAGTALIEAGNTLKEIDSATHAYGLALPSGIVGTTGIGGLCLGGGIGYLSRKGGLSIDHLLEARLVLASGEVVTASESSHPRLFWALRGGGGNFGVVVSFRFRLLPIRNVYGGPMFWPLEKAAEVMRFYDETLATASNDLYGFFAFLQVPPAAPFPEELHNRKLCGVVWNYTGALSEAEAVFAPIRALSPPLLDWVSEMPMPALNSLFDELYPPGMQWYWKALFLDKLSEEAIEKAISFGKNIPSMHSTTHFYPIDGKVHEIPEEATAWVHRKARWSQVIVGVDPDPANAEEVTRWCRDFYQAMKPYAMNGGAYVNFLMEEGQQRIEASYGNNYEKLATIKAEYDPGNLFHINQNIKPRTSSEGI